LVREKEGREKKREGQGEGRFLSFHSLSHTFPTLKKPKNPKTTRAGMMEEYKKPGWGTDGAPPASSSFALPELLLWRGASATGFFLLHHARRFGPHFARLARLTAAGRLAAPIDDNDGGPPFVGLDAVSDAVARLQGGRSMGKVVVQVAESLPPGVAGVGGSDGARARL
jgi:hypothetical protein